MGFAALRLDDFDSQFESLRVRIPLIETPKGPANLRLLTRLARAGNAIAQIELGSIYYYGVLTDQDYAKAFAITQPAAEGGHVIAQRNLGIFYENGQGVGRDYEKAAYWYRLSAEQGDACARFLLGFLTKLGKGVPQNGDEARSLFVASAEQGFTLAQFAASLSLVEAGAFEQARFWAEKAAQDEQVGKLALTILGVTYVEGLGVGQDYRAAISCFREAAERFRYDFAQYFIGRALEEGLGTDPDFVEAAHWYRLAAEQGYPEAQFSLAQLYFEGKGVEQNDRETAFWCERAAQHGHVEAGKTLASFYYEGRGVEQSHEKAMALVRRAAEAGDVVSQMQLAAALLEGQIVAPDAAEAAHWLLKAAAQGDAHAHFVLGRLHRRGIVYPQDRQMAANYFARAVKLGHDGAKAELGEIYLEIIAEIGIIQDNSAFMQVSISDILLKAVEEVGKAQVELSFPELDRIRLAGDIEHLLRQAAAKRQEGEAGPAPLVLPAEIPESERYAAKGKDYGRNIVRFLEEGWPAPFIKAGLLTRPALRKLDPSAYMGVANYTRDHELPAHIRLPTRSEVLDDRLSHLDKEMKRDADRLASAIRRRQRT